MTSMAIITSRIVLVAAFLGAFLVQLVVLPAFIQESLHIYPEVQPLARPYQWTVSSGILCFQIAIIATWILLAKFARNHKLMHDALPWISLIIWMAALGTFLVLALGVHLLGIYGAGGPGVAFMVFTTVSCGTAATVLLIAKRSQVRAQLRQ